MSDLEKFLKFLKENNIFITLRWYPEEKIKVVICEDGTLFSFNAKENDSFITITR